MVLECQDRWGPDKAMTFPYKSDFIVPLKDSAKCSEPYDYFGVLLPAFVKLGKSKGYRLIGINKYGFNAFFIN